MNMRNPSWVLILLMSLCLLTAFGCGTGDDDDDDNNDDAADDDDDDDNNDDNDDAGDDDTGDDDDDTSPPPEGCDTLVEGWNTGFMVDGEERQFYIDLPEGVEDSWPWPVVFTYYGVGDSSSNWHNFLRLDEFVDNDVMPFIGVTPEDTNASFLGWDIIDATEPNKEARLFDELVAEINRCWGVDYNHIHTLGHSAGGVTADLLMVLRGDMIASTGTHSGVYISNPANAVAHLFGTWPELTTTNKYSQLLLHGSKALDIWMILNFYTMNLNDRDYLNQLGHDVVICNHGGGHNSWPMSMDVDQYVEFFADHPLGTYDSPYATEGLPADFADYCEFSPK